MKRGGVAETSALGSEPVTRADFELWRQPAGTHCACRSASCSATLLPSGALQEEWRGACVLPCESRALSFTGRRLSSLGGLVGGIGNA